MLRFEWGILGWLAMIPLWILLFLMALRIVQTILNIAPHRTHQSDDITYEDYDTIPRI